MDTPTRELCIHIRGDLFCLIVVVCGIVGAITIGHVIWTLCVR